MGKVLDWRAKLVLIGDLNEILRDCDDGSELTPQQKKRVTIIRRKLEFANDPKGAPLNKR